jgi:hypothetical protein
MSQGPAYARFDFPVSFTVAGAAAILGVVWRR